MKTDIDILRSQIAFQEVGIAAGIYPTKEQVDWLEKAKKEIFWHQVIFDNAVKILGRPPISQVEAQKTVSNYNHSQNALSR